MHHWAISNRLATYDGTNLLGSVVWLGWGVGRGQSGSIGQKWPDFIEFDDAVSRDSMFIRSGKRLVGDRVRLAANPALGGPGVLRSRSSSRVATKVQCGSRINGTTPRTLTR